jgi:hypothetical protein
MSEVWGSGVNLPIIQFGKINVSVPIAHVDGILYCLIKPSFRVFDGHLLLRVSNSKA